MDGGFLRRRKGSLGFLMRVRLERLIEIGLGVLDRFLYCRGLRAVMSISH